MKTQKYLAILVIIIGLYAYNTIAMASWDSSKRDVVDTGTTLSIGEYAYVNVSDSSSDTSGYLDVGQSTTFTIKCDNPYECFTW